MWTAGTGNLVQSSPAVADGIVYVGSNDGKLYAFDAAGTTNCAGTPKTCSPLWTAGTGNLVQSSPAVASGVVYVGSVDHNLYAFDAAGTTNCAGSPKTCSPLWTAATSQPVRSSPAVADRIVYVGSDDGRLYAFDAAGTTNCGGLPKTCSPLWNATTGGPVESSPSVANGFVYFGSLDSRLYAYGLEKIPPTTAIVQPVQNAIVSRATTLVATASDNVSVSKVEFHLINSSNDTLLGAGAPDGTGHWKLDWDTTTISNGTYKLHSIATDPARNIGQSPDVTVTVQN